MTIYLPIFYKKKQIPSEGLYRAHLECVSQWQGVWLYVETSINMKFCNMNVVLYDKWNNKLDNLNTKRKKKIQTNKFYTCIKNMTKKYKLRYLN